MKGASIICSAASCFQKWLELWAPNPAAGPSATEELQGTSDQPEPAHAISSLCSPQLLASWKCFSFSFSWLYCKQDGWRGRFYICLWSRCNPQPCWSLLEARSTLVAARQGKSVSSTRRISPWALARECLSWIRAPYWRPLRLSSGL